MERVRDGAGSARAPPSPYQELSKTRRKERSTSSSRSPLRRVSSLRDDTASLSPPRSTLPAASSSGKGPMTCLAVSSERVFGRRGPMVAVGHRKSGSVAVHHAVQGDNDGDGQGGDGLPPEGQPSWNLPNAGGQLTALSWSPETPSLAVAATSTVCIWDVPQKKITTRLSEGSGGCVVYSPMDAKIIATGSSKGSMEREPIVRIFDTREDCRRPHLMLAGYYPSFTNAPIGLGEERARWSPRYYYLVATFCVGREELHVWDLRAPESPMREVSIVTGVRSLPHLSRTPARETLVDLDWTSASEPELVTLTNRGMVSVWDIRERERGPPRARRVLAGCGRGPPGSRMIQCVGKRGVLLPIEHDPIASLKLYSVSEMDSVGPIIPSSHGPILDFDFTIDRQSLEASIYALFKGSSVKKFSISKEALVRIVRTSPRVGSWDERECSESDLSEELYSLSVSPTREHVSFVRGERMRAPPRSTSSSAGDDNDYLGYRGTPPPPSSLDSDYQKAKKLALERAEARRRADAVPNRLRSHHRTSSFLSPGQAVSEESHDLARQGGVCFSLSGEIIYFFNPGEHPTPLLNVIGMKASRRADYHAPIGSVASDSTPFDEIRGDEYLFPYRNPILLQEDEDWDELEERNVLFPMNEWSDDDDDQPMIDWSYHGLVLNASLPQSLLFPSLLRSYDLVLTSSNTSSIDEDIQKAALRNFDVSVDANQLQVAQFWRAALAAMEFPRFLDSPVAQMLLIHLITAFTESIDFSGHEMADCLACLLASATLSEEPDPSGEWDDEYVYLPVEPTRSLFKNVVLARGERLRKKLLGRLRPGVKWKVGQPLARQSQFKEH